MDFVAAPEMIELFFRDPVSYVRNGGSTGLANVSPDHPVWVRFAKAMVPFAAANAKRVAAHVAALSNPPYTVLDIAAGHWPLRNRGGESGAGCPGHGSRLGAGADGRQGQRRGRRSS